MKKISIINSDSTFDNDFIFKERPLDHILRPWFDFKLMALEKGFHASTASQISDADSDYVIFSEMPRKRVLLGREMPAKTEGKKNFLLLLESEIIRPDNYDMRLHEAFCRVFTWDDRLVKANPEKYRKVNFSFNKGRRISSVDRRDRFAVCIASNKLVYHDLELYSARREWINSGSQYGLVIDLFGPHWGYWKVPSNGSLAFLNRAFRILPERRAMCPSWRGVAEDKMQVMERYKFSLCFENARDLPGYITEKIFDSFAALTIPIYRGANNVTDYIPPGCFIDARQFDSPIECLRYASSMPESALREMRKNIRDFMASPAVSQFTSESFSNQILATIAETAETEIPEIQIAEKSLSSA